ncbi:sensor histidine kinase [Streptomyces sp. NPDC053560]|uniref:sensor histidine kinase n=1 Tax=Streptomyces sp. NPDC053560 TaxID=3365711 RepID=UPI0037D68D6F
MAEVARALLSGAPAAEVLRLIARRGGELVHADSVAVLLPDDGTGELAVAVAHGDGGAGPEATVELPWGGQARGALRLGRARGRQPFSAREVELLSRFVAEVALARELDRRRREAEQVEVVRERDRIARDLHDLAIQRLFATGMALQGVEPLIDRPEAARRIGRAVNDLDETIKIIRSAVFGLRTAAEPRDGAGLRRRVLDVAGSAGEALGFAPALRMDGPLDTDVPAATAGQVVAVLAEALSNTARHAHARRVDVALTVADDVVLSVTDDGVGLAGHAGAYGDAPSEGGLANLRWRAGLLGGRLLLTTPPGGGTRLVWRVPLPDGSRS